MRASSGVAALRPALQASRTSRCEVESNVSDMAPATVPAFGDCTYCLFELAGPLPAQLTPAQLLPARPPRPPNAERRILKPRTKLNFGRKKQQSSADVGRDCPREPQDSQNGT